MNRLRLVSPVLMWAIIGSGALLILNIVPGIRLISENPYTKWLVLGALVYWVYFFVGALWVHHQAPLSAEKIDSLVTHGVYSLVRHPIYSADMVLAGGIFFYLPYSDVLLAVCWGIVVWVFWMKLEERTLIKKFGAPYLEYKRKVPMLLPKVKLRK